MSEEEALVQKTVRLHKSLMADVESEMAERGGIDFVAFVREAVSNEVRRHRMMRAAEEAAIYGSPRNGPPNPPAPGAVVPEAIHQPRIIPKKLEVAAGAKIAGAGPRADSPAVDRL